MSLTIPLCTDIPLTVKTEARFTNKPEVGFMYSTVINFKYLTIENSCIYLTEQQKQCHHQSQLAMLLQHLHVRFAKQLYIDVIKTLCALLFLRADN